VVGAAVSIGHKKVTTFLINQRWSAGSFSPLHHLKRMRDPHALLAASLGERIRPAVCVLYEDPIDGYPKSYVRDVLPKLTRYPDGKTLPSPKKIDFIPGHLLGSVSGELGLRKFLEGQGHELVVTSDKDGFNSVFERELPDAEVVISQPFWPAYLTAERIAKAPKLKLAITALDRIMSIFRPPSTAALPWPR